MLETCQVSQNSFINQFVSLKILRARNEFRWIYNNVEQRKERKKKTPTTLFYRVRKYSSFVRFEEKLFFKIYERAK